MRPSVHSELRRLLSPAQVAPDRDETGGAWDQGCMLCVTACCRRKEANSIADDVHPRGVEVQPYSMRIFRSGPRYGIEAEGTRPPQQLNKANRVRSHRHARPPLTSKPPPPLHWRETQRRKRKLKCPCLPVSSLTDAQRLVPAHDVCAGGTSEG